MKSTRIILFSLIVFALTAVDISAQTKSSASQVVTFGVRRIVLQLPSGVTASNMLDRTSLKVTVGSSSQVQSAIDINSANPSKKSSTLPSALLMRAGNRVPMDVTRESDIYASKPLLASSLPSAKLLVTLTD